jgi:hypothetical protein
MAVGLSPSMGEAGGVTRIDVHRFGMSTHMVVRGSMVMPV